MTSESGSQPSTIDYYHERKNLLMRKILERNIPIKLSEDEEVFCQVCKTRKSEVKEMHIEHPNNDGHSNEEGGGWQRLYRYEEQFKEGKTLWVVCSVCHYLLHRRREDGHAVQLKNGRSWLEEYSNVDPEFELEKRFKEGEIYA